MTPDGTLILQLELPADPDAPWTARSAAAAAMPDLKTLHRVDLTVLVSEVVAAIVPGASSVSLEARRSGGTIAIEASSDGDVPELDPLAAALLDSLTESWEADGPRVTFEIEAPSAFADSAAEDHLFARCAGGDEEARSILADRYQGFARALARRFVRSGLSRDDLNQVASMALVKALDRFDPERGFKFTTFAARTIEGELKRHLRDSGWSIRVPRGLQELGLRAVRVASEFSQTEGREPTIEEIAELVEGDPEEVGQALLARRSFSAASLDAPVAGADTPRRLDRLPDHHERLERSPEWSDLSLVLEDLPEREQRILYLRFFEDMSQSEIAEIVGISQMHVSRLLRRSFEQLRELIEGQGLERA